MLKRVFFVSLVSLVVLCAGAAMAAIPPYISFQGRLTDTSVSPPTAVIIATDVWFGIFDVGSGGTALWAGTDNITPDSDGIFNVILGYDTTTTFGNLSNLAFDKQYWVEVRVGTEPSGTRQMLTSVPYAFRAEWANRGNVFTAERVIASGDPAGVENALMGTIASGEAVYGRSTNGKGVFGVSSGEGDAAVGVHGVNTYRNADGGPGVKGESLTGPGVYGETNRGYGVYGKSQVGYGVMGHKEDDTDDDPEPAVYGRNEETNADDNPGVKGESLKGYGVYGTSNGGDGAGVYAENPVSGGPALELGVGWIKIPQELPVTIFDTTLNTNLHKLVGKINNGSVSDAWCKISNTYVSGGSKIFVTPVDANFATGVRAVGGVSGSAGYFEVYIPAGYGVNFLVINQ